MASSSAASRPRTVSISSSPSAVTAVPATTGVASSTPGTPVTMATTSSENGAPSPARTWRATRPAAVSMTSTNARMTARSARSIAHTSATPQAMAITVSTSRVQLPRRKRRGIRKLRNLAADRLAIVLPDERHARGAHPGGARDEQDLRAGHQRPGSLRFRHREREAERRRVAEALDGAPDLLAALVEPTLDEPLVGLVAEDEVEVLVAPARA